ncbi:MAG TPA: MFS transporter [Candidatus Dormibacteraeota bacterium]|nr:MFS transporter [Candidatus Dormibacteraeota bacterium]
MSEPTRVRQRVLAFTLTLTAIAYLDRVCISMAAPAMKVELGISDVQMGWVFSAFTFAYALFEVPSGWLADRFGARLMLTRVVVWWSAMTAATGAVTGIGSLIAVRFLFGVGEAGCFPSMARAYARWLPVRERGRAFGLTLMAGALGGAATQPLVVALLESMHWRHTFMLFGGVGAVWAVAWFWWFRDEPHGHPGVNRAELALIGNEPPEAHRHVPWATLLRDRNLLALCFMYLFAIYGWYFYLTWLPTYLLRERGFDLRHVGWLAALPLLSIATGVLIGGWLSDVLARRWGVRRGRRTPGAIGLPLAAAAIVAGIATPTATSSALFFAAAAGLAALGVSPAWAVCLEIGGRHAGVVSGAMNMFGNFGGALSPVVIGFTLQQWGGWTPSLLSIAVCYVLAAGCWMLIDPERPIAGC